MQRHIIGGGVGDKCSVFYRIIRFYIISRLIEHYSSCIKSVVDDIKRGAILYAVAKVAATVIVGILLVGIGNGGTIICIIAYTVIIAIAAQYYINGGSSAVAAACIIHFERNCISSCRRKNNTLRVLVVRNRGRGTFKSPTPRKRCVAAVVSKIESSCSASAVYRSCRKICRWLGGKKFGTVAKDSVAQGTVGNGLQRKAHIHHLKSSCILHCRPICCAAAIIYRCHRAACSTQAVGIFH